MALIRSGSVGTESPYLQYELYADQTGGSVNNRTIKITLKAKISSGYYGYPANWRANINGTWSGWMRLKGTESWNKNDGFRTFEYSATTDVGTTSSKAITVGFGVDSYNGDDSWDSTVTGSFTVGATNRPPNPPSNIIVRNGNSANSPVLNAGIVPENITTLYITWSAGSDPDGDQLTYALNESINNGGYVQRDFGTDLAHSYNTNGWDEGGTIQFYIDARDTKGAWSSKTYSGVLTKNRLTAGTIYEYSNNINFNTKSFEARFRGGSNTDKSAVTYSCYSDSITIYNQTYTSDTKQTILIWRTGDATPASNQPYIKFNELVELYRSNNFTGTLSMGLFSKNTHGTKKSTVATVVQVDLRVAPNPATGQNISTDTNHSPIYKKVAFSNNRYFIPDGSNVCRVHWNLGSGKLGESVRYEVYVSYNNGGWQKLADVPQGTSNYAYYNHVIPKQTVSQQFKYLIRTITSYGYYSDAITPAQTLHFYNTPGIAVGTITRGATTCDVKVTVKTNTSIPNVGTVGSWLTNPATSSGNLSASQGEQNIAVTGLTDAGTYTLKVTYNDNTGFSSNQVRDIAIGQNTHIFFVNKYGIGVNGEKADNNYATKTKGGMEISRTGDGASLLHFNTERGWAFKQGGTGSGASLDLVSNTSDKNFRIMPPSRNKSISFLVSDTTSSSIFIDGNKVYHAGSKPTAADVGALPLSGGTLTGTLTISGNGKNVRLGTGGNDIYLNNTKSGKYLQLKDDGTLAYSDSVIYHAGRKPTPADIGALSLSGGTLTGDLTVSRDKRFKVIGANTNLEMGVGAGDVFIHNTASGSYLQFNNNGNLYINSLLIGTQHYPIIDRDTNRWFSRVAPVMGDGVIEIGRYIDFHRAYSDGADYTARLDANGNCIWCSTSIVQNSDREVKENIKYLDDEPMLLSVKGGSSTPFKDFIKDFKFATYNYKGSEGKCFGFIAQDIVKNPVGKLLLQEHEMDIINKKTREIEGTETTLAFGLADYTSVVAKALQEEIREKDEKIIELESRLEKLENIIKDYESFIKSNKRK